MTGRSSITLGAGIWLLFHGGDPTTARVGCFKWAPGFCCHFMAAALPQSRIPLLTNTGDSPRASNFATTARFRIAIISSRLTRHFRDDGTMGLYPPNQAFACSAEGTFNVECSERTSWFAIATGLHQLWKSRRKAPFATKLLVICGLFSLDRCTRSAAASTTLSRNRGSYLWYLDLLIGRRTLPVASDRSLADAAPNRNGEHINNLMAKREMKVREAFLEVAPKKPRTGRHMEAHSKQPRGVRWLLKAINAGRSQQGDRK
ncbi:hypothetical protein EV421DRAFT_1744165 [Armillaria borealis]|uniref:Uncharacterized protein n=1 Tax=Armillaria borealis TaxID=47425 RepID=A0AA39IWR9_9AGAR|nr:hypothetical protein EV421DRAFT_1744165 [Armillaria borealis]